jgi:hypothetical protein
MLMTNIISVLITTSSHAGNRVIETENHIVKNTPILTASTYQLQQ